MSPQTHERDIEEGVMLLFAELGWATGDLTYENAKTEGRTDFAWPYLPRRLKAALERLNPGFPKQALAAAYEELTRDRSSMSMVQANRELYRLLKGGVPVEVSGGDEQESRTELLRVIDWGDPHRNDWFAAQQFWVSGVHGRRRADMVGFVNGLPLVFIELKAHHKHIKIAYDKNFNDYRDVIPQLFWFNGLVVLSNGMATRVGSFTAQWEHFKEWKRVSDEQEAPDASLETALSGSTVRSRRRRRPARATRGSAAGGASGCSGTPRARASRCRWSSSRRRSRASCPATGPSSSSRTATSSTTRSTGRSPASARSARRRACRRTAASTFIGFAGTPLMAGEEKTVEVFGDYVSVYNYRQAIEDGATDHALNSMSGATGRQRVRESRRFGWAAVDLTYEAPRTEGARASCCRTAAIV